MSKIKIADNRQWLVLWLGVMLTALYARPPIPIDETRYLSVAWEMWQSGEFLVPHINGAPYSQKPPLLFWTIHLFWWIFGVGEWQGRIVGPLFGLVAVALTGRLARKLWPKDEAVSKSAPYFLLGMLTWSLFSSLTMFDSLLTCCCLFAQIQLVNAEREQTIFPWVLVSLALGLGLLAKGPVALVFVGGPMLLAPWWSERRGRYWIWWYGCVFASLVAGIAIALCWAIPAAIKGGEEYGQDILFGQTIGRITTAFAHPRPIYWYALLLPLLCFPWAFWGPVWRGLKRFVGDRSNRFCLAFLVPGLLILSCISGKQIHYALPLLPIFALSFARISASDEREGRFDQFPLAAVFLLCAVAISIVTRGTLSGGDREVLNFLPDWLSFIPLACGLPLFFIRSGSPVKSAKIVAASGVLLFVVLHLAVAEMLQAIYQPAEISEDIRAVQEKSRQVAVFPAHLSDQFQFDGRMTAPVVENSSWDELAQWANAHPDGACLLFTKNPSYSLLVDNGRVRRYKDGWLIFRPAKDFHSSYRMWVHQQSRPQREPLEAN